MGITLLNDLCYGHLKDSMHVYVYILVYSRLLYNACVSDAPRCMFSVSLVLHLLEEHWLDNLFPASSTSDSGSELYVWLRSAVQVPVITEVIRLSTIYVHIRGHTIVGNNNSFNFRTSERTAMVSKLVLEVGGFAHKLYTVITILKVFNLPLIIMTQEK